MTHPFDIRQHLIPEEAPQLNNAGYQLLVVDVTYLRIQSHHAGCDEFGGVML